MIFKKRRVTNHAFFILLIFVYPYTMKAEDIQMAESEKRLQYKKEFIKRNYTSLKLHLNNEKDAEIIAKLNAVSSKTDYIRKLIQKDLKK